jgi:large subunit ribosomal protein L25
LLQHGLSNSSFQIVYVISSTGCIFANINFLKYFKMKTLEIIGYKRANLGKQTARRLRNEAYAPGVLYGGEEQIHFYTPMALLKDLVYTPNANFITFNIEGTVYNCILQDIQFHPVSETILHIDLLQIFDDKKIKMEIPTMLVGDAPGVVKGGRLVNKMKKMPVSAYPKDMPEQVKIDVSSLDLGQMLRVRHLKTDNYTILALPNAPVAMVELTRALRTATAEPAEPKKGKAKK